jgi:hypothetical protein
VSAAPSRPDDGPIRSGDPVPGERTRRRGGPLARALRRLLLLALVVVLGLLSPVAYVELLCRPGETPAVTAQPILPPEHRRPESNTLLTYPEWHIVRAYEDYAAVIRRGAPHDYAYLPAIGQYWGSLCALTRASGPMGGPSPDYRTMTHVIGVSFTAELLLKAAYEETLGRLAVWLRGPRHSPLDKVSARQATDYAAFLGQTPWYRWDFGGARRELEAAMTDSLRDRERDFALSTEYGLKAAYARLIADAVAATGGDELTVRSVVAGLSPGELGRIVGVAVIGERVQGVEIETPRYAAFTALARRLAAEGADFVEIAGNDEILVTDLAEGPTEWPGSTLLDTLPRQGNPGVRTLRLLPVDRLADLLRDPAIAVEHVHDY